MSTPAEPVDMAYDHDETRTRYVFVEGARASWPFPLISLEDLEEDD